MYERLRESDITKGDRQSESQRSFKIHKSRVIRRAYESDDFSHSQ